jgi:hypothetical protein
MACSFLAHIFQEVDHIHLQLKLLGELLLRNGFWLTAMDV